MRVGLVCFDESGVTAFRLSAEKEQPQAVHMADLDAPFLPIGEGALAPVGAASAHIDQALELVPRLFRAAPRAHRDRDAAMRCAWRIALKLLAPLGGTLLHVLSSPASRPGAAAEAAAVDFYAGLAASCAAAGVRPVAIACGEAEELRPRTLMPLACAAAGRVHLLPGAPAAEVLWRGGREGAEGAPAALGGGRGGELRSLLRFYLHCGVSSEAGFDALLRVRCTRGLRVRCVCGAGAVASGDGGIGGAALPDYGALRAGDLSSEEEGEEGEEEEEEEGRGDGGAFLGAVAPPPRWWLPALGDPLRAEGLGAAPCARWRSGAGGRLCGPAEEPERLLARMESDAAAPKRLRLARWRDRIALFRLAACDGATALSVELEHADEALQCTHACLQIALLYTTPAGERRLRVHNARLSLANAAAVSAASAPDGCGAACAALMLRRCAREGLPALLLRGGAALGAVRERLAAALGAAIFCPPREKASGIAPRRAPLPLPPCLSLLPHLAAVLARLPALQAPAGGAAAEEEALRLLCAMCGAGATRVLSALLPRVYAVLPAPGGEGGAAEAAEAAVGGGAPFPPLLAPCRQSLRAGGLYLVEDGDAITVFVGAECPAGAVRELFGADGAEELARRARGGAAVALRAPRGGERPRRPPRRHGRGAARGARGARRARGSGRAGRGHAGGAAPLRAPPGGLRGRDGAAALRGCGGRCGGAGGGAPALCAGGGGRGGATMMRCRDAPAERLPFLLWNHPSRRTAPVSRSAGRGSGGRRARRWGCTWPSPGSRRCTRGPSAGRAPRPRTPPRRAARGPCARPGASRRRRC